MGRSRLGGTRVEFLKTAEKRGGLKGVRDLVVDSEQFDDQEIASRILRVTSSVISLFLFHVPVDINYLARLQHLRRLKLYFTTVYGSPTSLTPSLPSLRYLYLYDSFVVTSASPYFTPRFLPQLRYLEVRNHNIPSPYIRTLLPQLEAVDILPAEYPSLASAT